MAFGAVLFDMGGTLLSYRARQQMGQAQLAALARLGLDPDDPSVRAARRQGADEVERRYAHMVWFLHRDLFRDRLIRTAELLGVHADPEVLARFDVEQRQGVIEHLVPMPDAAATLAGLRARGLYVAVVSNADDDYLGPVLTRHGLDAHLDDWTSSEQARSCKPDQGIFEFALAKAKRTAADTLFVGDSPQHDVAGARRAGMRTALIGDPDQPAPLSAGLPGETPDYAIAALSDLLAIVDAERATS